MKILLITHDTKNNSGWGRLSGSIGKSLVSAGLNIDFVVESKNSVSQILIKKTNTVFNLLLNIIKIRIISKKYDVVHALDVWPYGFLGYFAVVGTRKKLFINAVGTYSVAPLDSFWKKRALEVVFKRTQRIFSISSYVQKEILNKIKKLDKIEVVHLGFSLLEKINNQDVDYYSKKFSLDLYKRPIILTVGAIKNRKGQLNTLLAVNKLVNIYPNIHYVMVGDNSDKVYFDKIQNFIKENNLQKNVSIFSSISSDKELSFFYNACDLFVMNSNNHKGHIEGFGLVFLEVASFGKPVVGSRDCGIEDAIKDGFNGYLANQGDTDDIFNKIDYALKNKSILGLNSLEFVKSFSWDKTVSRYITFYNK